MATKDELYARFLRMDPLRFVGARFERVGDVFRTEREGEVTLATRSPEHLEQMLVHQADRFERVENPLEPLFEDGLVVSEGPLWKRRRQALQPAFRPGPIETLRTATRTRAAELVSAWPTGEFDLFPRLRALLLQVSFETLFAADAYDPAFLAILDTVTMLSGAHRLGRSVGDDEALWATALSGLAAQTARTLASKPTGPLLEHLLDAERTGILTHQEVLTELRSLLLGGHDTVASALAWACYFLASHPEDQERARDDGAYRLAVIHETLRLHPPAYAIPQRCVQATQLGDEEVPAGAQVIAWTYWIHRDARWYENPLAFRPSRFIEPPKHDGRYAPFSLGRHNCIGRGLAMLQLHELLAAVLASGIFLWDGNAPRVIPLMTLQPGGPLVFRWANY